MANAADLRIRITADGAQAAGELNRVNDALRRHGQEATAAQRHAAALRGAFTGLAAATATLYAGFQAAQALVDMVKAMIDAAVATERLTKGFQAVTGSQQAAGAEMAYLSEVANRLGLEVTSAGEAYLSLTAAAKGTALQGQAARDVFEAISLAMAKLGKSSADTQGALLAVEQMISKGKVSAEELRGQLGERLPGAFQAAAKAMGVTTQELDKLLQTGEVTAEEMLPKLAAELNRLYDDGKEVSGLTAEWNRFQNAMADAETTIANNTGLVNLLTAALANAASNAKALATWMNGEGWNNFATQVDRGNYLLGEKIRLTEEFRQKAQEVAELEGRSLVAEKLFPKLAPAQAELRALGTELGTVTQKLAGMAEGNKQLAASQDAARVATAKQAAATQEQAERQAELDREFDRAERQFEALDKAHAKHEKSLARVSKGTKAAAAATTDYAAAVRRLIDQYLPTEAAALRLAETQQLLTEAVAAGALTQEKATQILQAMQAEMGDTAQEAEQAADGFQQAWADGVKQLDRTFQGLWRNLLSGQGDTLGNLKDMVLEWLADLSYQLLLSPLIVPIQGALLGMVGGGAAGVTGTATSMLSGASSLTSLFSTGSTLFNAASSLFSGAAFSGISQGFALAMENISIGGYFGSFGTNMALAGSSASSGSIGTAIGAAAPYAIPAAIAVAAAVAIFSKWQSDQEPRYGTLAAMTGGSAKGLEDNEWGAASGAYVKGSFGLNFGLTDKGSKNMEATELTQVYQALADVSDALAQFFGEDLSAFITEELKNLSDFGDGLIHLTENEGDLGEAMAALVERIALAAGQSGEEIGIAFAAMVGDLGGTAEEVGQQIQAAMLASTLAVELSNRYNDTLGQMLGLTGDIGSDVQLLRGYVNDFGRDGETSADTLIRLSAQLGLLDRASEQTSTRLEGLAARDLIALSTQLADAFGNLDTAAQAMAFYYDQFSTNAEKVGDTVKALVERILAAVPDLQDAMQAWSITGMPETREAFENLIAGLDLTTESGRLLYAELLKLAPAFDALYDSIEAFQDWLLGSDAVAKATAELTKVFGEWGMALPATRAELEALYNSGAFTAEQLAILGGLLKELGLVFGDLGQAAEEVKKVVVDYTDLYIRLAEAQGNDALALQLRRQQELANAADNVSRALLLQIYYYEDLAKAAAEAEKIRREAYEREVEAIRARNEAAQRAADEANRAAEEALRTLQEQAREAAALATDIARAWLEALSAIGLATEALALQRKLQAAEMQPELRDVYSQVWAIQDRASRTAAQSDLAIQALGLLQRDDDATAAERALTLAATDPALREFQEWVFTLEDAREAAEQAGDKIRDLIAGLKEVSAALGSTIDRLDELMLGAPEQQAQRRRDAQAELTAALRAARAGTMPTAEGLERTLDTLSQDPTNLFATRVSYLRDLGRTRGTAAELQALVDAQVPIEEQNLEALKNLPVALYPNFESIVGAIGQLDSDAASILKQASAAIDAAIAAIKARDDALKQSITEIVPAIEDIPPYIEAIPPKLIPLQSLAKDIVANLAQIDLNVDGLVTFEEFASFFGKFMNAEDLARYFDLFDTNDDGIIDRLELIKGNTAPLITLAENLAAKFSVIDFNVDGMVTYAEFESFFKGLASDEEMKAWFDAIDTDNDGIISRLEAVNASLNPLQGLASSIALNLSKVDLNVNGQVEYAEFAQLFGGLASDEEMKAWFAALDLNGDSILDQVELIKGSLDVHQALAKTVIDNLKAIDDDTNGIVTYEEFADYFGPLATDDEIKNGFDMLDQNGDGLLSQFELQYTTLKALAGEIAAEMTEVDLNVNGTVEYDEFAKFFAGLASDAEIKAGFAMLDVNGDGLLSQLELQYTTLKALAGEIAAEMTEVDLNVNGTVEYDEFAKFFAGLASDAEMKAWFDRLDIDQDGILSKHEIQIGKLTTGNTNETQMLSYLLNVIGKLEKENVNSAMQITKLNDTIAKLQAQITELTTIKTNTTTLKDNEPTKMSYQSKLPPMLDRLLNVERYTYDTRNYSGSYFPYMSDRLANAELYTYGTKNNTADTTKNAANLLKSPAINYPYYYWPSYATGGISTGPTSGYPVTLHGREAVIPLGDGNSVNAILQDPAPPPPNYLMHKAADTQELRRALEELHQELAALRRDTQTIGAATAGELKDHNRRERRRDVVGAKVEVIS